MDAEDQEYVVNLLRHGTVKWKGRALCLRRARRRVLVRRSKSGKPVYKYHWQCAVCKEWSRDVRAMEVDHIIEIGGFKGSWDKIVPKFYCGQDNLQAMCIGCHMKKTKAYNNASIQWKRKPRL